MDSCWETQDTLLVKVTDQHDEIAWEQFISYYKKYIYMLLRRMNLSHHDTEEISQEVFVKVWRKIDGFNYDSGKGRFRGWLCVMTSNTARDFMRRSKARGICCEFSDVMQAEESAADADRVEEDEWRVYLSNQAWHNIYARLTAETADIFRMSLRGVRASEISARYNITENNVYNTKYRVQKQLRREIIRLEAILDV